MATASVQPGLDVWFGGEWTFESATIFQDHTMRFGSTAKVLAKCKLKYYRISEPTRDPRGVPTTWSPAICYAEVSGVCLMQSTG